MGPAGEDLFQANNSLVWLLSSKVLYGNRDKEKEEAGALRNQLHLRQQDLLKVLALPAHPWMVKMVGKLEMDQIPADCIRRLLTISKNEEARRIFQHAPSLPARVMRMVYPSTLPLFTPSFVEELLSTPMDEMQLAGVEKNLRDGGQWAKRGETVPGFRNTLQLEKWRWLHGARWGCPEGNEPDHFPAPPFPGTEKILPIRSPALLKEEGARLHHCVYSYLKEARQGIVAFYAIFRPERATLGLRKNRDGSWRIFDFRCACNREPSKACREMVETWFSHSTSKKTDNL
ncbi:MAG: PcfJ domain-containing protein [Verrucomicrobia bacterium]|nr:PcfJ domain-containing protein [Verrucomicrobiota bacterium]MCH8510990.1 PcfJ domain-containing protein [Kiritimatiellia bacterium]